MASDFISDLHATIRSKRSGPHPELVFEPKKYERFPKVMLPEPLEIPATFSDVLKRRRSAQVPMQSPLSLSRLSTILGSLRQLGKRRPYPSGGAKYPIDMYVLSFAVESLDACAYHYRSDIHALETLWPLPEQTNVQTYALDAAEFCEHAAALIVLTAEWERSSNKYGRFAFELALIEAGHIGQNICLSAAATDVAVRPLGGYKDDLLLSLLELDASREQPVYALALGKDVK